MVNRRDAILKYLLVIILSVTSVVCYAQAPTDTLPGDPGAITIYTVQNMSFGAFSPGTLGGTVGMSNTGVRSVTGDVIGLNFGVLYFQAIFDIDAPQGSIISILNGPNATLTGSNGGTMSVHIDNSDPGSPFSTVVAQPQRTQVNIGGTLTVGTAAASPPGTYSGTIYLTFNQE